MVGNAAIPTYEYRVLRVPEPGPDLLAEMLADELAAQLNALGRDGFQIFGVLQDDGLVILGRVNGMRSLAAGLSI